MFVTNAAVTAAVVRRSKLGFGSVEFLYFRPDVVESEPAREPDGVAFAGGAATRVSVGAEKRKI